jgi:predicted hotdog family 3-hydroxylacyl-ACP dehydratase
MREYKMKRYLTLALFLSLTILPGISSGKSLPTTAQTHEEAVQQKLAKQAKITQAHAQEVALKRAPGTVESAELEREHGKLVYSFDIRNSRGTITEVQVSAVTGRVVRVEHENKKKEAAEKKKETH